MRSYRAAAAGSASCSLIIIFGVLLFCNGASGAKVKGSVKEPRQQPQQQQPSQQHVRGDEDIWVGQAGGKNGTIRLLNDPTIQILNKSRTATYDDEEVVDERQGGGGGGGDDAGDEDTAAGDTADETTRSRSPSCSSSKTIGSCARKERRYYYSRRRGGGCRRFQGCAGAGGNNYKSLRTCEKECGHRRRYVEDEGYYYTED